MTELESPKASRIETNGINVIADHERHGHPRSLFWPWTAASISVFSIPLGTWALGFQLSIWQLVGVTLVGVIGSGLLCGLIALAGKRGGTPTLVASRAAFGVRGNALPTLISWIVSVGWEVLLVSLATLATATVFDIMGLPHGTVTMVISFAIVIILVVGAGVLGFATIMKLQTWLTIIMAALTIGYFVLVFPQLSGSAIAALPAGTLQAVLGATILIFTSTGLGWVNAAADYSRYLPRQSSSTGVIAWTTTGLSIAPIILILFGGLLTASKDSTFADAVGADPIGALARLLPLWYLIPFVIVAVLGLVAGAVLDIYSSGLSLLTLGLKVPRYAAAGIDGVIMVLGTIYIVFIQADFLPTFQGFIITLGVPLAAWAGVMCADIFMRRKAYDEYALFNPLGMYRSVRWLTLLVFAVASAIGLGLVTSTVPFLRWEGYLLGPIGLGGREGVWAASSIGVAIALILGFGGYLVVGRRPIIEQDAKVVSFALPETGRLPDFRGATQADAAVTTDDSVDVDTSPSVPTTTGRHALPMVPQQEDGQDSESVPLDDTVDEADR